MWVLSQTEETITAVIPFGTPAGPAVVALSNVGANQLSLTTSIDVTALVENEASEPNNTLGGAQVLTLPLEVVGTVSGADFLDVYSVTFAAATTIDMLLEWDDDTNGDLDLHVIWDGAFSACTNLVATGAVPEHATCAIPAGKTVFFRVHDYEAQFGGGAGNVTSYHLVIKVAP
jgi:hypothetical protein